MTSIIKKSKLAVLCVSDSFADDEKCVQVFELIKNIIKKNYLLVEFGPFGVRNWIENPIFVSVCSDFRIIMQDPNRYGHKLAELLEILDRQVRQNANNGGNAAKSGQDDDDNKPIDVFISYCWANSKQAVGKGTKPGRDKKGNVTSLGWLDPRTLVKFFKVS